ncbi:MAG: MFS transporter [Candidatus Sericytochromatia bacterium]
MRDTRWNWLYTLGFLGVGFVDTLFAQWIVYLHAPPGSADPRNASAIGTILLISFVLQALFNPALGHLSDRLSHTRWAFSALGPRLPLIMFASLPMALVFYALWQVTAFWPSLLLICLYGLLFVTVVQPFMTLLPTLAPDPALRVRYSLIGGVLSLLATGAAMVAGPQLLESGSFASFGLLGGLSLVLTVFIPSLLMREASLPEPSNTGRGFLTETTDVLSSKPLASFFAGNAFVLMAIVSLTILSPFLCETVLRQNRTYTSVMNLYAFAGVLAAVTFVAIRGKQLSFLRLMRNLAAIDGLLLLGFGAVSLWRPIPLPLWHLCFILLGCLIFVGMMAPNLILAEFSDRDHLGRRGVIFGLNGLAANLAHALAAKSTAALLVHGKSAAQPLGVQLGLLFAAVATLLAGLALTVALRFQARIK